MRRSSAAAEWAKRLAADRILASVLVLVTIPPHASASRPSTAAGSAGTARRSPALPRTFEVDRRIDVNQINMWVRNDGTFAFAGPTSVALAGGLLFPKGSPKNAVFGSGLWLGAKVGGETRTAAGQYATEYVPGTIVGMGPDNPGDPKYRVYKMARYGGSPEDSTHVARSSEELSADPTLDPLLHDSWSDYLSGAAPYGAPTRLYRLPDTSTSDPSDSVDVLGPDVLGDQMLWAVYNDADLGAHGNVFQTAPLGVEVQQTTFAFNRQGPLGNTVFLRFKIINKGGNQLDSMYVSLWSDPDLGIAGDDLVGCDSTLSLGFVYNATNDDGIYGSTPPSVGYDFFLGPVDAVTGDTLGLASFNKYINGTDPGTAGQVYNYMRGFDRDGGVVTDPTTGQPTRFYHPGDPVQGIGWLDSNPSDRRFLLSAGPFHMSPGDTQIVVGAIIVGRGNDRLSSISALKFYDLSAQDAFDRGFDLPSPPAAPKVVATEEHGEIRLCWDSVPRLAYTQPGYAFEGFNVYQGASATGPWKRIATYDEINSVRVIFDQVFDVTTGQLLIQYPVAFGSDTGIRFCHEVTQDAINGGVLHDGTQYYFAVTSYSYGPSERPKVLETSQEVVRVIPQHPAAGTDPGTASPTLVQLTQIDPSKLPTTDQLLPEVVDPSAITGHQYRVTFTPLDPPYFGQVGSDTATVLSAWNLEDLTRGTTLLSGQLNRHDDQDYQVVDGMRVRLVGSYFPHLQDAYYEDNVLTHLNNVFAGGSLWGVDGLGFYFGGAGAASDFGDVTTSLNHAAQPDSFVPVEVRFNHTATQLGYRFLRLEVSDTTGTCTSGDPPPGGRGYLFGGYLEVPLTAWDVARNRQLDVAFVERTFTDCSGNILPDSEQPVSRDSTWTPGVFPDNYEYLLVLQRPYETTPDASIARDGSLLDSSLPLMYALVTAFSPYETAAPALDDGDAFKFAWQIPASPNDVMTFDTQALVRGNPSLAKENLKRIRVVPNPYYNQSRYELTPTSRVIRFINMPETATVRIYNLAGHLARTLRKTDTTTSILNWDLLTESGLPVGSGIYIYHVDVPGVGSAFGRMAVFMETERLSNY